MKYPLLALARLGLFATAPTIPAAMSPPGDSRAPKKPMQRQHRMKAVK